MAALTPWRSPSGMLDPFRREMEDLMHRFFGNEGDGMGMKLWSPSIDVEETDKEYHVKADLPGVDPKAVEVTGENNTLTLRGARKEEMEEKNKNYHRVERFSGSFYRSIPLPEGTDAEKVSASSANGVVTISIPKKAGAQPKKIPITAKA